MNDPFVVDKRRLDAITLLAREFELREELRIFQIAWRIHHEERKRSSWGWASDHATLKAVKERLERQIEELVVMRHLLEDPKGERGNEYGR